MYQIFNINIFTQKKKKQVKRKIIRYYNEQKLNCKVCFVLWNFKSQF